MKKRLPILSILILCLMVLVSCAKNNIVEARTVKVNGFGNVSTNIRGFKLFNSGFDWGDIVQVELPNQTLLLPLISDYHHVDSGEPALKVEKKFYRTELVIFMGSFASEYNIGKNEKVSFSLYEKAGYLSEYQARNLVRTNRRSDYQNLTDNQYANFRKVSTSGISNLYRTSNPVDDDIKRNTYADAAIKDAKVTVILNLADTQEEAENRREFKGSYYSSCKVAYLNLGSDPGAKDYKTSLAQGLAFLAENKGTYAVHCTEGKDRAGFVCALLECLMGASAQEVAQDYMITYYNYYGVEEGSEQYEIILEGNLVKTLEKVFAIDDFWTADLQQAAQSYILSAGLSQADLNALMSNL